MLLADLFSQAKSFLKNPTKVGFEHQHSKERTILLLRQHLATQIVPIVFIFSLLILPLVIGLVLNLVEVDLKRFGITWIELFFALATWYLIVYGLALERFLLWYFNVYIVTNERIIDIDFLGIAVKRLSECNLNQIQDITFAVSGPIQTIFHFGDVLIQTAAEKQEFEFHSVPNPDLVVKEIMTQVRLEEAEPAGLVA